MSAGLNAPKSEASRADCQARGPRSSLVRTIQRTTLVAGLLGRRSDASRERWRPDPHRARCFQTIKQFAHSLSVNCSCRLPANHAIISPREAAPFAGMKHLLIPTQVALKGTESVNVLHALNELLVGFHGASMLRASSTLPPIVKIHFDPQSEQKCTHSRTFEHYEQHGPPVPPKGFGWTTTNRLTRTLRTS